MGKLVPERVAAIVGGIAGGCQQAGCALIGGETAEMPGFYGEEEYDIAGFAVGVVDRDRIIDGRGITPGYALVGLPSSGLHSNGYSLARKALLEVAGHQVDSYLGELGRTVGEEMLEPTRIYARQILPLLDEYTIGGMAHITGGGLTENVPRMLPQGTVPVFERAIWPVPPIFSLIQSIGQVEEEEMYRTFNMGIGLVLAVPGEQADSLVGKLSGLGETAYIIGTVREG